MKRNETEQVKREIDMLAAATKTGALEDPDLQRRLIRLVGTLHIRQEARFAEVSDKEAREFYEANKDEFEMPIHRFARQILIAIPDGASDEDVAALREEAVRIRADLGLMADSSDFAEFAAEHSDDGATKWKGGLLPATAEKGRRLKVHPLIAETLFSLRRKNEVSAPFRTDEGWHIVQFVEEVPRVEMPFEKVKNLVVTRIENSRHEEIQSDILKRSGITR